MIRAWPNEAKHVFFFVAKLFAASISAIVGLPKTEGTKDVATRVSFLCLYFVLVENDVLCFVASKQ